MMKVALVDDDASALNETLGFLNRYCRERGRELVHTAFLSPVELMAEIERGVEFDVLFLDILMPGQNGIETAEEVRSYDRSVKIIFLTSSAEFAVESYKVGAFFYQLKPLRWEGFVRVMDSVLESCRAERESGLILHCKDGITCLDPEQLEFCEVIHRTLLLHLTNGTVLESIGSLGRLYRQLMPFGCFLQPHRSYIVNLDYVQTLSARDIIMFGQVKIPLSNGKRNEVKKAFLAHTVSRIG